MRSVIPIAVVLAGLALIYTSYRVGLESRTAKQVVIEEFEEQWARAIGLGAPRDRPPRLEFWETGDMGGAFARTYCNRPRPIVIFDTQLVTQNPLFAKDIAVPHEMAHVLNCYGPLGTDAAHGLYWRVALDLLVDPERALEIIEQQASTEKEHVPIQAVQLAPPRL
jgi:hypothetical protein